MATQDRMPPIAAEHMTTDQKKAAEAFAAGRGYGVRGPFAVMLRSPEVMLRAKAMGDYLRFRNVLPKRVSEMVILITAREWTQQYEWAYHYGFALEAGLSQAIVAAIAEGRRPEAMQEDEAAAYDFSVELHRRRSVSDVTYARALQQFGEQGIIDLVGISGYYTFNAMMMNVARSQVDIDNVPPLQHFPD
ncbi:MAG TPA: carboxymuconolactone decarboxylase family protein [Hyphomicrobiaceae bacterium]|nr:carboxymuconolactone decarboxylase family protein [Hyphomicrobiaceae bacterium]